MNARYLALLDLYAGRDQAVMIISAFVFGLAWIWHLLTTPQLVSARRAGMLKGYWFLVALANGALLIVSLFWKG